MKRFVLGLGLLFVFGWKICCAQTVSTLVYFNGVNGSQPEGHLLVGPNGTLYGTTAQGGNLTLNSGLGYGTIYQAALNGVVTTLNRFNYTNGDAPYSGMIQGPDGNFYGTTQFGGSNGNYGTIFQLSPNGVFNSFFDFSGTNGDFPYAPLAVGLDGGLYGDTGGGGTSGAGVIYRITTNGAYSVLTNFTGVNGQSPYAGLTLATSGIFYGCTPSGNFDSEGELFAVSTNGALTVLTAFPPPLTNGSNPMGALTLASDGSFYGTTGNGGSNNMGTVFHLTGGTIQTLVNFNGTNGSYPESKMTFGPDGNLYGVTPDGGTADDGTVFRMTTNGVLTTLFSFEHTNGQAPNCDLTLAGDGNFYGTTRIGGTNNYGTLFRLTAFPTLTITPAGLNIVLTWSTNFPGFFLQSSPTLGPTAVWTAVLPLPVIISGQYTVTNAIASTPLFYRLVN